jgi:nucleotide-binding universal stress UspA family protein
LWRRDDFIETVKKILIPVDGSDLSKKALKKGLSLARLVGAEVTVMHVIEKPTMSPLSVIRAPDEDLSGMLDEPVKNLLNFAKKECKYQNISYKEIVVEGLPAQFIIDMSKDYDIIMITPLGRSAVTDLLMGSVAEKVIRHAKCAVVVVR